MGIQGSIVHTLPSDIAAVYERPFVPIAARGIAAFYPGQITAATDYFEEIETALPRVADKAALILWPLQDPGFPRSDLTRWERVLPNHHTVELPNAKHFFFEDATEQVVSEIPAYLERSSGVVRLDRSSKNQP